MGQPAITGSQFVQWLRTEMADQYKRQVTALSPLLTSVMQLDIPSDKLIEFYGYYLAAPHMRLWRRGENISEDSMDSVSFSVQNYDWGQSLSWHENDRLFEQTKSLIDRAQDIGRSAVRLHERIFMQYITAAADNDLMPFVPNAPDGVAMFSATDGAGAARFGVTGGNLVSTSGVASPSAVRTDLWTAIGRLRRFQDGKGQPYWTPGLIDEGFTILYGAANSQVFAECFQQRTTQGSAGATNAVSNIIFDADIKVNLWPTFYITDNSWYIFAKGAPKKPVFHQNARNVRESWATMDMNNSDAVRKTRMEYYQVDTTWGYGVALPIGALKIA